MEILIALAALALTLWDIRKAETPAVVESPIDADWEEI